jgi:hypothetical protein
MAPTPPATAMTRYLMEASREKGVGLTKRRKWA